MPVSVRRLVPLAVPLVAASLAAQADWHTTVVVPKPRAVHASAYDSVRDEVVVFGGNTNSGVQNDTWIWSPASGWRNARPTTNPPALREHAMAFDSLRSEVVLFGGWDGSQVTGDTWLWNGTDWRQVFPANSPSPRMSTMGFDPVLGRVILFGGEDANATRIAETWSWDGTNWAQHSPTNVPPARVDHAMATDWGRGEVVLFGGWDNGFLRDTWTWNGSDWTAGPAVGPSARSEHAMAYAGGEVVLFGGHSVSGRVSDTWGWNGSAWTIRPGTPFPALREEHVMSELLSTGGLLMFGGWDTAKGHTADTWTFAGGRWTELTPRAPTGSGTSAADHDPTTGATLLFGGYQDQQVSAQTWLYVGGVWSQLNPATAPPARAEAAMAYDRVRGEFVLFGGVEGSNQYNDTWVFRGGNWQQRTPAQSPPARWGHVMVFDETSGTTLLFSGRAGGSSNQLTDTWEWDGTNWMQLAPATSPAGREDPAMAYDPVRGETLLFGGWVQGSGFSAETWAFRGGNWVQLSPANWPTARSEHTMAFDRVRERLVLFGGQDSTGRVADTWEYDGSDWFQRSTAHAPEPREEAIMVFDEAVGEVVLAVGWDVGHFTDTWHFGVRPPASVTAFGTSCSGSLPNAPELTASLPWLGESMEFTASPVSNPGGAVLLFGAARSNVALDPIGMVGCHLYTSPLASAPMVVNGSSASLSFPLPSTPSLVGVVLVNQAAVLAAGANPTGVLATGGLELATALK